MNHRTIHPLAPWLIAGVLLISGGIVFRVWAQQVTALTPAPGTLGIAEAEGGTQRVPRLGSKTLTQSADNTGPNSGQSSGEPDPEQSSKIAVSPAVAREPSGRGSSGGKSPGDSGSAHVRPEPENAEASATPTVEPIPVSKPRPEGALFALLRDALAGASLSAQETAPEIEPEEAAPLPSAETRLLKASQVLQIIYVEWELEEKLTPLLTQSAAQRDVTAILAALRAADTGYRLVHLVGLAPRVGQAAPPDSPARLEPALWLTYDAAEIERIDWSAHPGRIARIIYDHAAYARDKTRE